MPNDEFLSDLKAAWRNAHTLLNPLVMAPARDILAKEDLAGGLALLKPSGRSL